MIATCATDGCPRAGEPLEVDELQTDLETGSPIPVSAVICGACSCAQQITDDSQNV